VGDSASEKMLEKKNVSRDIISDNTLMQIFVKNNDSGEVYSNDIFDYKKYMAEVEYYPFVYEINYAQNTMYLLNGNQKTRISTRYFGNLAQNRKEDVTTYIAIPDNETIRSMKDINENEPLYMAYKGYIENFKRVDLLFCSKIISIVAILLCLAYYLINTKEEDTKIVKKNVVKSVLLTSLALVLSILLSKASSPSIVYIIVNTALIYGLYHVSNVLHKYKEEGILFEKIPILEQLYKFKIRDLKKLSISNTKLNATLIILINPALIIMYFMVYFSGFNYYDYLYVLIGIGIIVSNIMIIVMVINKINNLETIKQGISEIKKGNLNYKVEIKKDQLLDNIVNDINEIGETINIAVEDRLKSERMKNELITNVSHDLKTPLTAMINYISLMKNEDIKPSHIKDYVQVLDKRSQRLKILIEDLFEASKIGSNNIDLELEENDINQLLTQTLVEMEEYIDESNLDFVLNLPEKEVYILADGKKTFRVFENIVNNILKYSLEKTRVYIDLIEKDNKVSISFKNISKYQLNFNPEEITERFTRGDLSRNTEGSGLGLAIAKGLVEAQDGSLKVDIIGDLFIVNIEFNSK
ncbi:MAG: sensor histidine kinase, partial [Romboutsia sp.]|uniref:sensor histidine kinase n=1 Tax=Romboutsia sp. TaxID=1965302 RepID=UPI003F371CAC